MEASKSKQNFEQNETASTNVNGSEKGTTQSFLLPEKRTLGVIDNGAAFTDMRDDLDKDRESSVANGNVFRFGQFVLDSRKRTLTRTESPVSLTPKAFDVLLFLLQNPNRLVTKGELLQAVWGDTFVEEGNLTQYISHLRKALGDHSEDARMIVTIARKGYQFTGDIAVGEAADTPKQIAVGEKSPAEASPAIEFQKKETTSKISKQWRTTAIVGVLLALILSVIGYIFWRHFRPVAPARSERIRLAVLPFANLTGDPNKEYLADGLTEEMISQLARLNPEQLGVIARTSVMGYKSKDTPLDQIGRDLSVQYVLENSVRANGNQIRLSAQLIQVKDQTHMWSQDYDYLAKDFLNVEDEVARAVAREIQLRLTSQQQAGLTRTHPINPEAFEAYFQGRYLGKGDPDVAAKYFERATQLDPNYAVAWTWLARAHFRQTDSGRLPTEEGRRLVREAADRALALDPNLAPALTTMGRIKQSYDFDWAGGAAYFQRALALEPANPEIIADAAGSAAQFGRFDEALRLLRRAFELDPLNARMRLGLGEIEYRMGALDEAIADLKKGLELNPQAPVHVILAEIYVIQGRSDEALAEIEQMRPGSPFRLQESAIAYHALGREKESETALQELITKHQTIAALQIAEVYAFRKERDKAFEWLDRAYAQRDGGVSLTKIEPLLKNLHDDPRYVAFLKKINLSP